MAVDVLPPPEAGIKREESSHGGRIFYEVATSRLDEQIERIDSLNGRAQALLAMGGVAVSVGAGAVLARAGLLPAMAVAFVFSSITAYIGVVLFGVWGIAAGKWSHAPALIEIEEEAGVYNEQEVRWWIARQYRIAVAANEPQLAFKGLLLNVELGMFAFEIAMLAAAVIFAAQ